MRLWLNLRIKDENSSAHEAEVKVKFFTQLNKAIDKLLSKPVSKSVRKGKSPNTNDIVSRKSTPEVASSTGTSLYGKKKNPNKKLTDHKTISNVYVNKVGLRKSLMGIDRKSSKTKQNRRLRKRPNKQAPKRKEYKLIDLTLNHETDSLVDGSECNFTNTENSLPPLDRSSKLGSEPDEENKQHERYSRSHERAREPRALSNKKQPQNRYKQANGKTFGNNSIIINDRSITLASGDPHNMRSDKLSIQKEFSFDKQRATNKTETKMALNSSSLSASIAKANFDKKKFQKVKQNFKLRKFSRSDQKPESNCGSRSNSRKSRILSNSSSRSKINFQEFTRLKLENEKYQHALTEMVSKFMKFKTQVESQQLPLLSAKTSESGSSIIWKDRCEDTEGKDKAEDNKDILKDKQIATLKKQLSQKDSIIAKLKQELEEQKKLNGTK